MSNKMVIAIDGPSAAGKSTIAKILAQKLGITYLDTGAMYRALALKAYRVGVDAGDEDSVKKLLDDVNIEIVPGDNGSTVYLDGENVSTQIRENHISKIASDISALKIVRFFMVNLQRKIAGNQDIILDGRDIGTYVLPDAKYKFFITASPEERARRRYLELTAKGYDCSEKQVLEEIKERDYNDSHREVAPLKKADDAIEIDCTNMSVDEVEDKLMSVVRGE